VVKTKVGFPKKKQGISTINDKKYIFKSEFDQMFQRLARLSYEIFRKKEDSLMEWTSF
jgi:hypothetical protein